MVQHSDVLPGLSSVEPEWMDWYRLSPSLRWQETGKLWAYYQSVGGSLDPESDRQSPFHVAYLQGATSPHGRPGVRVVRRGRI